MNKSRSLPIKLLLRSWQGLRLLLELICFAFCLYLLSAWIFELVPVNTDFKEADDGVTIYVVSTGVHTDVCMPATTADMDWHQWVSPSLFEEGGTNYISVGWGDKGFYLETPTWDDLTFSVAFKAVLLPSTTAMHVSYEGEAPREGKMIRSLQISDEQYARLVAFVKSSFEYDAEGKVQAISVSDDYYRTNDRFFEAEGSYSGLRTCNTWTNEALKECGIINASWAVFSDGVFYHLPAPNP